MTILTSTAVLSWMQQSSSVKNKTVATLGGRGCCTSFSFEAIGMQVLQRERERERCRDGEGEKERKGCELNDFELNGWYGFRWGGCGCVD
jgi:hypothetical protein